MQHVSQNNRSIRRRSSPFYLTFALFLLGPTALVPLRALSAENSQQSAPGAAETPTLDALETPKIPDTCELISRGPGVALQDSEVRLHTFLERLLFDLQKDKFEKFSDSFHPRAKVAADLGDKIRSIIISRYNAPLQYSVFRVWRIRSPSASKQILDNCPESDGAKIITSYGYAEQFAVWVQIMGQNELGRLIFSIAPDKGRMSIVGFRIQQWTQSGADWRAWATKGEAAEAKKNIREAYIDYDISQKLLEGKDLVLYPMQTTLVQKRKQVFSQAQLVEKVNSDLGITSIAYIGTLLAKEGSGIFLREYIAKELSAQVLDKMCVDRGLGLQKSGWLDLTQGLRCNYIFKGMNPLQDSDLGGYYKTAEDLRPQKK